MGTVMNINSDVEINTDCLSDEMMLNNNWLDHWFTIN
jgi:hypothetical protein